MSVFHCVTTWSKFDLRWNGVRFVDLAAIAQPKATACFVIFEGADYYTTNLPIEDCPDENVILADELFSESLSREHGGPLRLIVPKL